MKDGEILFIDEIHRMNKTVEEYLYSAMEDFVLDIPKSARIPLAHFTLVGATTQARTALFALSFEVLSSRRGSISTLPRP